MKDLSVIDVTNGTCISSETHLPPPIARHTNIHMGFFAFKRGHLPSEKEFWLQSPTGHAGEHIGLLRDKRVREPRDTPHQRCEGSSPRSHGSRKKWRWMRGLRCEWEKLENLTVLGSTAGKFEHVRLAYNRLAGNRCFLPPKKTPYSVYESLLALLPIDCTFYHRPLVN